jgi:hypothetical protein
MERMTDLTHLVEKERRKDHASIERPPVWLDRVVAVVLYLIVMASGLVGMGIIARLAWECMKAGWNFI